MAGHQRVIQRRLVDDATTGGVHQEGALLHLGQPSGVEQADGGGAFRAMDGHEIGPRQGGIQVGDRLISGRDDGCVIDIRVEDQHVHVECGASAGGPGADSAEAQDQHGLAGEFHRRMTVPAGPLVVLHQFIHQPVLLRQRDHQVKRLFGDAGGIGGAGGHQRHAARGQCRDFHRVEANADAGDNLHCWRRVHLGLLVGRAGQGDAGAVRELRQQIGLGNAAVVDDGFDVVAGPDDVDTLFAHGVRQHHLTLVGGHGVSLHVAFRRAT